MLVYTKLVDKDASRIRVYILILSSFTPSSISVISSISVSLNSLHSLITSILFLFKLNWSVQLSPLSCVIIDIKKKLNQSSPILTFLLNLYHLSKYLDHNFSVYVCVYMGFIFLCMCMHACMPVCLCVCVVCMWRPEVNLECHPSGIIHPVFSDRVSYWSGQWVPGN